MMKMFLKPLINEIFKRDLSKEKSKLNKLPLLLSGLWAH